MNNDEMTQQLFKAIDAIVNERLRDLPYDKTIVATIANISSANYGKYIVTTDSNITFDAYSENPSYALNDRVYVRIPENNYSKQKVITGKYIPDANKTNLNTNVSNSDLQKQINAQKTTLQSLQEQIDQLNSKIGEKGE